jgi:RHS repeat-associated protein
VDGIIAISVTADGRCGSGEQRGQASSPCITVTLRSNERNELCWTDQGEPDETGCNNAPGSATLYEHDNAGGQTRAQGRYRKDYDERGRTRTVTPDGRDRQEMAYAGLGQSQRTRAGELAFEHALTGVDRVSNPSADSGDALQPGTTRFVRAPDGTIISQRNPDGSTDYLLYDAHPGSVSALARTDGTAPRVTGRFRYDPYGNNVVRDGSSDTPWRFAAGWHDRFPTSDPDRQGGLYKMGERYYDPLTGRWTQADPIDQASDLRQSNPYTYVAGDPINYSDPTGMFLNELLGGVAIAAGVVGATALTGACFAATRGIHSMHCLQIGLGVGLEGVMLGTALITYDDPGQ